jgi:undecaprenyl phosphate-alpha-L-ara4N flippase subunit ArnE
VKLLPLILLSIFIVIETIEHVLYRLGGRQRARFLWFVTPAVAMNLIGLGLWLLVLRYLPLSQAMPLLAANNVTVALAGKWIFGEVIHTRRWIGIILIVSGFVLITGNPL